MSSSLMQKRRRSDSDTPTKATGITGRTIVPQYHFVSLITQAAANNTITTVAQRRFINIKFIGINAALHDALPQTISGGNKHHIFKTRFGIQA